MLNPERHSTAHLSLRSRLLASTAGADIDTLSTCPKHDVNAVCAVAGIMILTAVYQTALFTVVGHRLFASPGQIDPVIPAVAAFIAYFILKVDAYTIVHSGFHLNGIAELRRGGLDISGGPLARVKSACLLTIRILLALGIAQLTAIFVSILVFSHDIDARIDSDNVRANASLVASAAERIDANIQHQRDDIAAANSDVARTVTEAETLRVSERNLMSGEPKLEETQAEVAQLLTAKSKADDELQEAETFAVNEAAGIKGGPNNSGQVGEGVRYHAAAERVANGKARVADASAALEAARGRLDDLTKQFQARTDASRQQIEAQLAAVETAATAGKDRVAAMNDELTRLINGRDDAIQAAVRKSPDYVPKSSGLLIQIAALRSIADGNREVGLVILLIEVVSFGFELAAVLAKVTGFVPTSYAAYLARNAYINVVTIVDEMARDLEGRGNPQRPEPEQEPVEDIADLVAANDNDLPSDAPPIAPTLDDEDETPPSPPQPPKRPRGRPRKVPAEQEGSQLAIGQDGKPADEGH